MSALCEPPLDPELPFIDIHRHLFDRASETLVHHMRRSRCLGFDCAAHVGDGLPVSAASRPVL